MVAILPPWVQAINQGRNKDEELFRIIFFLMKEVNMSYHDIVDMPIPALLAMIEQFSVFAKAQDKEMKKMKRKK